MKRVIIILSAIILILAGVFFYAKPLIIFCAQRQLGKIFTAQSVTIKDGGLGFTAAWFSDIEIKKEPEYSLKLKKATVRYDLPSLLSRNIKGFSLAGVKINAFGVSAEELYLEASQGSGEGDFSLDKLTFNKLKIEAVSGLAQLEGKSLALEVIESLILGGEANLEASLELEQRFGFQVRAEFWNLNLARIVNDFEWQKKVELSGTLNGSIRIEGDLTGFTVLEGDCKVNSPGGVLTIKDKAYLDEMAKRSNVPYEIIVSSLQHYRYNEGKAKFYLKDNNLYFYTSLNGETGKRDLDAVFHDLQRK